MGWWCMAAAPDLRARLRLTGCCIPVVEELQRQLGCAGQKQPQPHPQGRRRRAGGDTFPTPSLPAGAALGGLPLPEGREEARADTAVGTRGAGGGICAPGKISTAWDRLTTPWRMWATCGCCDVCRDRSGRQDLPRSGSGRAICVPLPVSSASTSASSAVQSSPITALTI